MNDKSALAAGGPLPPVLLCVAIILMALLHAFVPVARLFTVPWRFSGAVLIFAGLALNVWADGLFKRAGTSVKLFDPSSSLVVDGPFSFSRNPMYLGMVLVLVGIAVGLGGATPWLVIPVFAWLVDRRFVVPEERKLEATFGARFLEYKARVRRWI